MTRVACKAYINVSSYQSQSSVVKNHRLAVLVVNVCSINNLIA
jgi:hypothetical protein